MAGKNSSRTIVIHAATLEPEKYQPACGNVLATFVAARRQAGYEPNKAERFGFLDGRSCLTSTDFRLLSPYTRFPFGLAIPQSSTEAILLAKLESVGITVSRLYKAVSTTASTDQEDAVDVHFKSGESVQVKYVNAAVSPDNLKEKTVYRIISGKSPAEGASSYAPTSECACFQDIIDSYVLESISDSTLDAQQLRVKKKYWSARFRIRSAIPDSCFKRFGDNPHSGDAAHICSLVGGEGLSLGIRNAITLGPALTAHIRGDNRDALLVKWAAGRRARALGVILDYELQHDPKAGLLGGGWDKL
ncbi:FAD/NAD(P)-binding domain-containing protein [Mycena venus]|uniref:FAD/NAD(P)-binding domain-containing protein n=1 Tax=Mycena venus TaxID=2733690 RepID=A0A8H7CNX1_9AGAR|nr:FAD/NAD(P)-binding domain-containing protein [Mycena venus]